MKKETLRELLDALGIDLDLDATDHTESVITLPIEQHARGFVQDVIALDSFGDFDPIDVVIEELERHGIELARFGHDPSVFELYRDRGLGWRVAGTRQPERLVIEDTLLRLRLLPGQTYLAALQDEGLAIALSLHDDELSVAMIGALPPIEYITYEIPWRAWSAEIEDTWLLEEIEQARRRGVRSELVITGMLAGVGTLPQAFEDRAELLARMLAGHAPVIPQRAWAASLSVGQLADIQRRIYVEVGACEDALDDALELAGDQLESASRALERACHRRADAEHLRTLLWAANHAAQIDDELSSLDDHARALVDALPFEVCFHAGEYLRRVAGQGVDVWWVERALLYT